MNLCPKYHKTARRYRRTHPLRSRFSVPAPLAPAGASGVPPPPFIKAYLVGWWLFAPSEANVPIRTPSDPPFRPCPHAAVHQRLW
jgi:hypothetical protein